MFNLEGLAVEPSDWGGCDVPCLVGLGRGLARAVLGAGNVGGATVVLERSVRFVAGCCGSDDGPCVAITLKKCVRMTMREAGNSVSVKFDCPSGMLALGEMVLCWSGRKGVHYHAH